MFRRRPAASTHQSHSRRDELPRVTRHVFRRAQVDVSSFYRTRHASIRLRGQRQGSDSAHALDRVEHRDRPNTAVAADDISSPVGELGGKSFRVGTVKTIGIFVHRYRGDDRQFWIDVASCQHRLMQLLDGSERLKNQKIDATFGKRLNLLTKCGARFLERSFAQWFDSNSQRANRTSNPDIETLGGFACKTRAGQVYLTHFIRQAMSAEAEAVGSKSIGFNNFCASLQVALMHGVDQVRL